MSGKDVINTPPSEFEEFDTERELECALTGPEWEALALEQAHGQVKLRGAEKEKKETNAGYNEDIKVIEERLDTIANKIASRAEPRTVKVHGKRDFAHGKKTLTRQDTRESWEETLTPEEMQRAFPDMDGEVVFNSVGKGVINCSGCGRPMYEKNGVGKGGWTHSHDDTPMCEGKKTKALKAKAQPEEAGA